MRPLTRKLLRDLREMRAQAAAIALVAAAGIAVFVASMSTYRSLAASQTAYYERYRFADIFARLTRAPEPLAARIASLPGVAQVETRVVADVVLDVPAMPEPAVGRLVSIPERPTPHLNDIYLRRGRYIEPNRSGEVLASEAFAAAHGLAPGDAVSAVVNGRWQRLEIVGIALSPEYVYQVRGTDVWPDDRHFGVLWMGREALAAALDMEGAFNDVSVTLTAGASAEGVRARLDRLLEPYGGRAVLREDQLSHRFLSDEIAQLRGSGLVVPSIFLGVSAFLLNVVLARLVGTQRSQIATLKAFGYPDSAVLRHYLGFVLLVVAAGALAGTVAGAWLGRSMTELYTRFFRFPVLEFRLEPGTVALAVLIGAAASVAGGLGAAHRAAALPPAQAMLPEPPATFGPTLLERLGLHRGLPPPLRMILRNLERRPARAALATLAMSLGVAMVVVGGASRDAIRFVLEVQFHLAQRADVTVTFDEPKSSRARYETARFTGVLAAEPFRAVPVRLVRGHRSYETGLLGLPREGRLRRLVDRERRVVRVPETGVVLTAYLARLLDARPGDRLTVEVQEGARPSLTVAVAGLVDELIGASAYMDRDALARLLHEGGSLSGAWLSVDPLFLSRLYRQLKTTPGVGTVAVRSASLEAFERTVAENLRRIRVVQVVFAVIIAFGVVYNGARVALAERARELGTLRVIGFTRLEVLFVLLGELALLTLLAIPPGLAAGYGLVALVSVVYATELFRLPVVVAPASGLLVGRAVFHLDLVGVLKSRE